MQIRSDHNVFPDYLTVTYAPDFSPDAAILDFLLDLGCTPHRSHIDSFVTPNGFGMARKHKSPRWTVHSFSGDVCQLVIRLSEVSRFIQILLQHPHKVTRLDLTKDIRKDDPDAVMNTLQLLWSRATHGSVALSRKAIPAQKCTRIQTARRDRCVTGTIYFGSRKDRYYAKVYDKRAQLAAARDMDIGAELLRYEVTAAKGAASLRDFVQPDALFYYLASPDLLPIPPNMTTWSYSEMNPLILPDLNRLTSHERMIRLVENSPDLELLRVLVDATPTELPLLLRKIEARLQPGGTIGERAA